MSDDGKMSGPKWTRSEASNPWALVLPVGPVTAYVDNARLRSGAPHDHAGIISGCVVRGESEDATRELVEAKLREMYDALREHFEPLPVLRWVDDAGAYPGETVAFGVNGWSLGAAYGNWWLEHKATGAQVLSPRPNAADAATNRRAAEAALRSLGVAFRVEGGAK